MNKKRSYSFAEINDMRTAVYEMASGSLDHMVAEERLRTYLAQNIDPEDMKKLALKIVQGREERYRALIERYEQSSTTQSSTTQSAAPRYFWPFAWPFNKFVR
jgi:hypothetical protein